MGAQFCHTTVRPDSRNPHYRAVMGKTLWSLSNASVFVDFCSKNILSSLRNSCGRNRGYNCGYLVESHLPTLLRERAGDVSDGGGGGGA